VVAALVWPSAASRTLTAPLAAAPPAMIKSLALEVAPVRGNLIAAGSTNTPSSASLPGDRSDERRVQLRTTLPTGRVVVRPTSRPWPFTS
jgi:NAD(P)-dependent dehydrogenase (short-subunit alcohol dehydrogenase family)